MRAGLRAEKRDHQYHVTTLHRRSLPASEHVGTLRHLSAMSSPPSSVFKTASRRVETTPPDVKTLLLVLIHPESRTTTEAKTPQCLSRRRQGCKVFQRTCIPPRAPSRPRAR